MLPHNQPTLEDFDYDLPEELIAQEALTQRDQSKLLVRSPNGSVEHRFISELPEILPEGSLVVVNESKVFPSRLLGHLSTGAKIEIFLIEQRDGDWAALAKPLKKLKEGTAIYFADDLVATVERKIVAQDGTQFASMRFSLEGLPLEDWLSEHGFVPLPPYIKRPDPKPAPKSPDRDSYQTIYARQNGSVAAPTAGLHFTSELVDALTDRGIDFAPVCLHVGAGTFMPVKSNDLSAHHMHSEKYQVPHSTLERILDATSQNRPVIAVGTTSLRCLESFALMNEFDPEKMSINTNKWHSTDLFLRPKYRGDLYRPWAIDALLTNFHQPKSTLFMLIASLVGLDSALAVYKDAVQQRYRFFSYGDSSLFWL